MPEEIKYEVAKQPAARIIFLDIDGVLNCGGKEESRLNPELVATFQRMLPKTGAQVVISSSWRDNPYMAAAIKIAVCDFIDVTPQVTVAGTVPTQRRGVEIQAWLDQHPEVDRYAIIDDTGIMLESQIPNYFQTNSSVGFTDEIAGQVVTHLART